MSANPTQTVREEANEQGFAVLSLRSPAVQVSVVPELGAKVISLQDRRTGREWMWHPAGELRLFANRAGDDFSISPLAGMDECLPTIAPCSWRGRSLPDHGEVWAAPWRWDEADWEKGLLTTRIRLRLSPLEFERQIRLQGNEVQLQYQLRNRSSAEEWFLWAMHPLLRMEPGDRLKLPASTQSRMQCAAWNEMLDFLVAEEACAKWFVAPISEGWAAVQNPTTGDALSFHWNPIENQTLGLWLTRGGWHGHHHLAIEPTNGQPDALDRAAARQHCGVIPAESTLSWQVGIRVGPSA